MPVVNLPDELSEQLNESETGTIDNTQGPGVAVYWAADGRARADIYMGLILDGFAGYQNISSVDPRVKMQFALPPTLSCELDDVDFDPSGDYFIRIMVNDCLQTRDFFATLSPFVLSANIYKQILYAFSGSRDVLVCAIQRDHTAECTGWAKKAAPQTHDYNSVKC